MLKKQW